MKKADGWSMGQEEQKKKGIGGKAAEAGLHGGV